jgi:hypothetical protein
MDKMTNAELISGFAGPLLMAVSAALLINRRTIAGVINDISNAHGFIFFAGILTLLAGLAIVRAHNVWAFEWSLIVTLLGWMAVIGGIVRILWPDRIAAISNKILNNENAVTAWALVALLLGAFLTAKGYALI